MRSGHPDKNSNNRLTQPGIQFIELEILIRDWGKTEIQIGLIFFLLRRTYQLTPELKIVTVCKTCDLGIFHNHFLWWVFVMQNFWNALFTWVWTPLQATRHFVIVCVGFNSRQLGKNPVPIKRFPRHPSRRQSLSPDPFGLGWDTGVVIFLCDLF